MRIYSNYNTTIYPQKNVFRSKKPLPKTNLVYSTMQDTICISKLLKKINCNKKEMSTIEFFESLVGKIKAYAQKEDKTSIDTSIFGCNKIKDEIYSNLIMPLINKQEFQLDKYPASILLYGEKDSIEKLITGISKEVSEKALLIDKPEITIENFEADILKIRDCAKKNYLENKQRTIVVFRDVDKYLSISPDSAEVLGIPLDEKDINFLNSSYSDVSKVALFKSLLDSCSFLPDENAHVVNSGEALTFIMTSTNPHLMSPDLIHKADRVSTFALVPPYGENLKETIIEIAQFYNKDFLDTFDDLTWEILLKELNPNSNYGGMSRSLLEKTIENFYSKSKTNQNPFTSNLDLAFSLLNTERDISSKECAKTFKILKHLGDIEKNIDYSSLEELVLKNELGLISKKDIEKLKENELMLKKELDTIIKNEKTNKISKKMQKRKEIITEIMKLFDRGGCEN